MKSISKSALQKSVSKVPSHHYLFSFGVIADLQYCDQPNSKSFAGKDRYHRNAMRQVENLFEYLKQRQEEDEGQPNNNNNNHHQDVLRSGHSNQSSTLAKSTTIMHNDRRFLFAIHMGDLIDLNTKSPSHDMHTIISQFEHCYGRRVFHMTANHDFYHMHRDDVLDFFGINVAEWAMPPTLHHHTNHESSSFCVEKQLLASHVAPTLHHLAHITDHSGKPLQWDNLSTAEHTPDYNQLWKTLFPEDPEYALQNLNKNHWIWDQENHKILRRKSHKHAHLPTTVDGWRALNKHEKKVHHRERKFIDSLNHALKKHKCPHEALRKYSPQNDSLTREGHYSFIVDNIRFIVLDTYDISILAWPESHPNRKKAEEIIQMHHPKGVSTSINSSTHLEGDNKRFVAFNGGIGKKQLKWMQEHIEDAQKAGQRVIISSHVPFLPSDDESSAYLWNYKEVLDVICNSSNRGVVVACLSGHAHRGGYQLHDGIHHVTFEGSVETTEDCFAEIFVYHDKLELVGHGVVESRTLSFPSRDDLSTKTG